MPTAFFHHPSSSSRVSAALRLAHLCRVIALLAAAFALVGCDSAKKKAGEEVGSADDNLVILGETFDNGSWPATIQRAGDCATVVATAANASSFGAQLRETCSVQNRVQISTQGYTSIQIKYDFRTHNYDAGETLTLDWSKDGKSWQTAAVHPPTVAWTTVTTTLPTAAEGQTVLYIRLSTNANGNSGTETADIDNFSVSGTAPAGCNYPQLCTAANTSCGTMTSGTCGTFSCGSCAPGQKCDQKQCVFDCSPAAQCGASVCGDIDVSGCGTVSCGACGSGQGCVAGTCVDACSATAVCAARDMPGVATSCGPVDGGACGQVDCGACKTGDCQDNLCACVPKTCADLAATCGRLDDGCGRQLDCGDCPGAAEVCSGEFKCGADTCTDCAPLTTADLSQFEQYLDCSTRCSYGKAALVDECMTGCPAPQKRWDKNRDGKLDDIDHELALIEKADAGSGQTICYEDGAVVPIKACRNCAALKGAPFCNAKEGTKWAACGPDSPCDSFDEECRFVPDADRKLCAPRSCASSAGGCTAFHLSLVSQDNDEVVVQVSYDYSPVPATVLDLYLSYEGDKLLLGDARPLAALTARSKQLQSRQMGPDRLRLTVLGEGSSAPIGTGPIIELVFIRTSAAQTALSFSASATDRTWSIAPDQGTAKDQLIKDSLWGGINDPNWTRSITVPAADPQGNRLLLHYSFDNAQKPLDVAKVESGESLCLLQGSSGCPAATATGQAALDRIKAVARYSALQRGFVRADEPVSGVSGNGVFLDGISDHLELPITLNQPIAAASQSFTASFWFYGEGDQGAARQVLWSHNHPLSENSLFAVTMAPKAGDTFDLEWMAGTLVGTATKVIKAGLPNRRWTNLAIAYDATVQKVQFYLDGSPVMINGVGATTQISAPVLQCPQFSPAFKVGEEGLGAGTKTPQLIYFASDKNGLFGLDRMDTTGLAQKRLLREPDSSAMDVDYSPTLDKIVFSSSKSGNYEIWVANGDGSNPRQVTFGFGDTARHIAARRPRFAPDSSAVVFESNVYNVVEGDNSQERAYRLFYLGYDSAKNEFAIPFGDGQVLTSLEYSQIVPRVSTQSEARILDRYRLTTTGANSFNAFWASPTELWYTATDPNGDEPRVRKLLVTTQQAANSTSSQASYFTDPETDLRLLAAAVDSVGPDANPEPVKLLQREWVSYDPASGFTVTFSTPVTGKLRAKVTYTPPAPATKCWDTNINNICDLSSEDRNADNACTVADCLATKVENLYLLYPTGFTVDKDATGKILDQTSPRVLSAKKDLRLTDVTGAANYVRIEVRSDIDIVPITSGSTIATVDFTGTQSSSGFQLQTRKVNQQLYVHHPGKAAGQQLFSFVTTGLEQVLSAAFSPNAEQLVLAAIERARPVLVTTPDLVGTVSGTKKMRKISDLPVAVEGLQWVSVQRSLPCNWMGAFRDPGTKAYLNAFRGGLDEVRLHSYVRNAAVIRSEAERGLERVAKNQPGGPPAKSRACVNSIDCPAYQVCGATGTCVVKTCDPTDPYSCGGTGKCTLASTVEMPGGIASDYVCAAECAGSGEVANSACFSQECRNGPCRYCDGPTNSCIECRPTTTTDALGVTTSGVEGCPDRNSFACVAGSCVTECYAFVNNESKYLCDPATEYCKQGRCMTFDWSWTDLAPATFSGMSEMYSKGFTPTVAVPQLYPVEIEAYGVEDYGHSPEILVQAMVKGSLGFMGKWFDLGRVTVYNRTATEAKAKHYILLTSYPITDLRVKLVTPPVDNQNSASTGLGHLNRDVPFCGGSRQCDRRAPGSLPLLGYSVGVPKYEVDFAVQCRAAGGSGPACDWTQLIKDHQYTIGGSHSVVITEVKVNGVSNPHLTKPSKHKACSYAGTNNPLTGSPFARQLPWFGSPQLETSNQKTAFYPAATSATELLNLVTTPLTGGVMLLNCGFALPDSDGDGFAGDVAGLEFNDLGIVYKTDEAGKIKENANGCIVDRGGPGKDEPCREYEGDARLDFMTEDIQIFKTLEFQEFTSFGYPTNSP